VNAPRLIGPSALLLGLFLVLGGCETTGSSDRPLTTTDIGGLVEAGMIIAGRDAEEAARGARAAQAIAGATTTVSPQKERELGGGLALQSVALVGPVHPDEELQRYVNLVGRAVARNSSRPDVPYTFTVLESPEINAIATPGGYIFITTGALRLMEDEAELAGVLAHEVAHVSERHLLQMFRRQRWIDAALATGAALREDAAQYSEMVGAGQEILLVRGHDRNFEYAADRQGTEIAALAGYDPRGLQRFIRKMGQTRDRPGGWLSTHPSASNRLDELEKFLATHLPDAEGARMPDRFRQRALRRLDPATSALMNDVRGVVGTTPAKTY
jgi:predicted Zn-dependent protease